MTNRRVLTAFFERGGAYEAFTGMFTMRLAERPSGRVPRSEEPKGEDSKSIVRAFPWERMRLACELLAQQFLIHGDLSRQACTRYRVRSQVL